MVWRLSTAVCGAVMCTCLGGGAPRAEAQSAIQPVPADVSLGLSPGRPRVRPMRVDVPPVIDGQLDDEAWRTATVLTQFTQQSPLDGAPATEPTEVYVAYDSEYLYFGFAVHYSDPSIMRANRVDRDRAPQDDLMTVYFDTFLDQQRAYDFDVNGYGVQGDGIIDAGGGRSQAIPYADRSWDALFETAGQIVNDGYRAEMAIPFKSLRYPRRAPGEPHQWGFQIVREIKGKNQENDVWAPMSRDEPSFLAQMGLIEGMTGLSTSRNLEFLPTFTAVKFGALDETTGAFETGDTDPDAGLNVKYGVTSNLIADFTVNPDFSQIESDRPQIEVNRRFPLFFSELRPFFLEGAEIFSVRGPVTFVHTRTIVDPRVGGKLSGKAGNTALGVLFADDEAPGNLVDVGALGSGKTAKTFIGRVKHDLYTESHIGGMFTNREFAGAYSRLGMFDGDFRLGSTHTLGYRVAGTQRRDADDAEGAETTGYLWDVDFRKQGRNLSYFVASFALSPDFETDSGFVRRQDQKRTFGNIGYQWWPESWLINWGPEFGYGRLFDFDGVLQDENASGGVDLEFAKNISVGVSASRDLERFEGIDFVQNRLKLNGRINTSRAFQLGAGFDMGDQLFFDVDNPFLGRGIGGNLNATLRPVSRLQSRLSFDVSRLTDPRNGDVEVFNVKIVRAQSTYQFTDRLLLRNITEFNTFDGTLDLNLLFTYRVNAGTVFYGGYDDHYQQAERLGNDLDGDGIDDPFLLVQDYRRTNRAVFMKVQYLFRY